eukprot:503303_1
METESVEAGTNDKKYLLDKKNTKRNNKTLIIVLLSIVIIVIILLSIFLIIETDLFKNDPNVKYEAGVYGKWSSYGGNPQNQQISTKQSYVTINETNIVNLSLLCMHQIQIKSDITYNGYSGYITVDDEHYAYITDGSGDAYKLNLNNCQYIWRTNIATLLGYNSTENTFVMRQTATLFRNSNGIKGILFGTPNFDRMNSGVSFFDPCWAIALDVTDGSLIWKTKIGEGFKYFNAYLHGFMVDNNDHFAYGGLTVTRNRISMDNMSLVGIGRGKMFKLDINNGKIINVWNSIDENKFGINNVDDINVSDPYIYRGVSLWNYPAIIDDYLIFGTGNMYSYPKYIENCLLRIDYEYFESNSVDPCNVNRSLENVFWKCLEIGVYPSSFIILNKKSFRIEATIPLQGIDNHDWFCRQTMRQTGLNYYPSCMRKYGPDADLAAVAAYKHNGILYGIAAPKSGHLYVFEIPSGRLKIAKKIGPWSFSGGNRWNIAVDEQHMIGIATITGGFAGYNQSYKMRLADGTEVCQQTGTIHAVDLTNGYTIWQIINPFGTINECDDPIYDNYVDIAFEITNCQRDFNGEHMKNTSETVLNVVIPPIGVNETGSALFTAPVTIANDMVFIPSFSGHIFVHKIFDGHYITTLKCPHQQNIKGGVTVIDDRVLFYCGFDTIVSMKLHDVLS